MDIDLLITGAGPVGAILGSSARSSSMKRSLHAWCRFEHEHEQEQEQEHEYEVEGRVSGWALGTIFDDDDDSFFSIASPTQTGIPRPADARAAYIQNYAAI